MAEKIRVLYVDDEIQLLELGKLYLEQSGDFTVTTIANASEAIRLLEQEKFDAIISDYQMPGMDGIQFLVEVRKRFGPVPFILFTGRGREEVVIQAINSGADFYLQKGGEPKSQFVELAHKIKSAASRKRAEDSLRKSEDKYRRIIEGLTDYLYTVHVLDGRAVSTTHSATCVAVTGYTAEEFGSDPYLWISMVFEEDQDRVIHHFKGVLSGKQVPPIEHRIVRKDGQVRWVRDTPVLQIDTTGNLVSYDGVIKDITEAKVAEVRLKDRETRFRELFNTMRSSVAVYKAINNGADFVFADFNTAAEKTENISKDAVIGKRVTEVFPGVKEFGLIDVFSRVWRTGTTEKFPIAYYADNRISGWRDNVVYKLPSGEIVAIYDDVTERKQAEEEITFKNLLLTTQQETSLDGILIVDEKGKILSYNRHFIDLWEIPDDVVATGSDELVIQSVLEKFTDPGAFLARINYLYANKAEKSEEEILLKDGRILDRYSAPMFGEEGKYYGRVWYFRDVTKRKRAEAALQEEQQFSKLMLDSLPGIFYLYTYPEHQLIRWNKQHETLLGFNSDELKGKLASDWHLPELKDAVLKATQEVMEKGQSSVESNLIAKDGHTIPFFLTGVRFEAKGQLYYMGIGIDITDRKRVDEELRLHQTELTMQNEELRTIHQELQISRDQYIDLYDTAPMGYLTISQEGLVLKANLTAATLLNSERSKLIKAPVSRFIVTDDQNTYYLHRKNLLDTGQQQSFDLKIRQQGEISPIWAHISMDLVPAVEVAATAYNLIIIDITERKLAEDALRKSEEQFRQLFSGMPSAVAIYGAVDDGEDFVFRDFNTVGEVIEHIKKEDVIGRRVTEVFPGVKEFGIFAVFQRVWRTGKPEFFPMAVYRDAHDPGTWRESWVYRLPTGEIVTIYNDVTDRKRAETALHETNSKLKLLSSITRHDILNQLMALKGYIEISREYLNDNNKISEFLAMEEKAANTIEQQIMFTKDYQELGVSVPKWQNVNASIKKAIAGLPMRDIQVEVDPKKPTVFADRLFDKVFYNLFDNALHYGGDQMKTIRVSSKESDAHLTIICEDDGVGITAEDKKHLFTRGFGKNTGLGLFLSREILAITGITITENGVPGKGARFEITVPKGMYRFVGTSKK